jgi:transposase
MTKHYPVELRVRAVKMVLNHLDEYRSVYAACQRNPTRRIRNRPLR